MLPTFALNKIFLILRHPCLNVTFPFQVKDLILDNTHATQIEGLTDEYTALESLSLINVGLTSLKGFPKLPNLQKVIF